MGDRGYKEMAMLMNAQPHARAEKKQYGVREDLMQTAKSTYDLPPMVLWNQVDLKLSLDSLSKKYHIMGDLELDDNGNSFSYQIIT
jgi:hypothetical protein